MRPPAAYPHQLKKAVCRDVLYQEPDFIHVGGQHHACLLYTSRRNAENFRITDDHLGEGGPKAKYQANVAAVSYTHLDVYKRQIQTPPNRRCPSTPSATCSAARSTILSETNFCPAGRRRFPP